MVLTSTSMQIVVHHLVWQDFGGFLRRMRQRRGLSQERLAEQLGCHRTYIWRLEHCHNRPSNVFLHNLKMTFELSSQETTLLAGFEYLRSYHRDEVEIEAG